MRINFTARHFKASDQLKQYAEKKVQRLKKYYNGIIECEIILDYVKLDQIAEIAVKVYSQRLVAIEKSPDIYKSIDLAVDKLERQVKKYKEKLRSHDNNKATTIVSPPPMEQES